MKTKMSTKVFFKRLLFYLLGMYSIACGIALSAKSALGVSPVSSMANVAYQIIGVDRGVDFVTLGVCTTVVFIILVLLQALILKKDFKFTMLFQLLIAFMFGYMVDLAVAMMSFIPAPSAYPLKLLLVAVSIPFIALGVLLYLPTNFVLNPGDGLTVALHKKYGLPTPTCKLITDCSYVFVATVASLIYFHGLVGVREGTIAAAVLGGVVLKFLMRHFHEKVIKFLEVEE